MMTLTLDNTSPEQQVRDFLRTSLAIQRLHHPGPPPGYAYSGPTDLVLQCGRSWPAQPLPPAYARGVTGYCFDNAYKLARRSKGRLRYCEGYAWGHFIPVEHAWCVNEEDRVVDVTWDEPGHVYLGVVIELPVVAAVRRARRGCSALFDWQGGYPLCKAVE